MVKLFLLVAFLSTLCARSPSPIDIPLGRLSRQMPTLTGVPDDVSNLLSPDPAAILPPPAGQLYHGVYPGGISGEESDLTLQDLRFLRTVSRQASGLGLFFSQLV